MNLHFVITNIQLAIFSMEKKAHVDSIMQYLHSTDKEMQLKTINAIEKYGTWEHGDKLGAFFGHRNEEIVVPVVRTIAATGGSRQIMLINAFIKNPKTTYNSPTTYIEIMDSIAKIGDMKKLDKSAHKTVTEPLHRLESHENPLIAQKLKIL